MANSAPIVVTLATFSNSTGGPPVGGLVVDAAGNLVGVTEYGGAQGHGTVYELARTASGYAAPSVLAAFDLTNGGEPVAGLVADAAGNLFGPTDVGGTAGTGAVVEIRKTPSGYAPPTVLVSFDYPVNGAYPDGPLTVDVAGDIFGTTQAGSGTIFEIPKSGTGYGPDTKLASFDTGAASDHLVVDPVGNIFGTTRNGGTYGKGRLYELARTATGYGPLTTLVSFDGANGSAPASLTRDAAGNLFGVTAGGGTAGDGTIFEIARTASGYQAVTTVATFHGTDGSHPDTSLTFDAAGDIFGATSSGGSTNAGTIFEVAHTTAGYAAPRTLASVSGASGLTADAAGNLFGTTADGFSGAVIELPRVAETIAASLGATSAGGTAVTLSGTALGPGTTVSIYDGTTLLGSSSTAADGSWSVTATLAAGRHDALHAVGQNTAGQATDVAAPVVVDAGVAGQRFASSLATLGPNGRTSKITYTAADGSIYAVLTYAADGSATIAHPGITGQPYTTEINTYAADGTQTGFSLTGFTGRAYSSTTDTFAPGTTHTVTKTYFRNDGSIFLEQTRLADGSMAVAHPDVTGQPYTAFTNTYAPFGALVGSSYAGYTGRSYDTDDRSYASTGKPSFKALLVEGVVAQTTAFDANGIAQATTTFTPGRSVTNAGLFEKAGTADTWTVDNRFTNTGTVRTASGDLRFEAGLANSGTLDVGAYATLRVAGGLTGAGAVDIHGAGSVFEVGAASGNTVAFTDTAAATLQLDDPSAFGGRIQGFGTGSVLDLKGFSGMGTLDFTPNASGTAGTLTVTDGSTHASLALLGHYASSDFAAPTSDAAGTGMLIRHA